MQVTKWVVAARAVWAPAQLEPPTWTRDPMQQLGLAATRVAPVELTPASATAAASAEVALRESVEVLEVPGAEELAVLLVAEQPVATAERAASAAAEQPVVTAERAASASAEQRAVVVELVALAAVAGWLVLVVVAVEFVRPAPVARRRCLLGV